MGRYRLKHVNNTQSQIPAGNKRQQAYHDTQVQYQNQQNQPMYSQARMAQSIGEKRTKSVRPRRPTGQHIGGSSNMRGGGRRQIREEQAKHRTMGQAAKSKFDSIAQAYNSSQAQAVTIMRDDYESSSQ